MAKPEHSPRRTILAIAKVALALVILAYLVRQAQQHDAFSRLVHEPKHWWFLGAALACTFIGMSISFIRWHILVRAVGIQSPLFGTLRLASLGFMLNFVTLGSIGGDLFRAIFLARQQPGQGTHAVASVIADRLMGLMMQLSLASVGILAASLFATGSTELAIFCRVIIAATVIGWSAVLLLLLVPALSGDRVARVAEKIPIAGRTCARLIGTVRDYRGEKRMLAAAAGLSLVGVLFYISSYYFVARGLPVHAPSWTEHLVIVPVAGLAGAIPATPNGLGTLEAAIEVMYQAMPGGSHAIKGDGTMVALAHRLTMMAVALVGMTYYFLHRAEVEEMIAEAEQGAESGEIALIDA